MLLIEDDDDTRETTKLLLELNGFRVVAASNGWEGLRVLEQCGAPCLILLDWMMPVMSGREFLDALAQDAQYADTPVLVVTAFSDQEKTIPARHLRKPVAIDELIREVRAYCGSP